MLAPPALVGSGPGDVDFEDLDVDDEAALGRERRPDRRGSRGDSGGPIIVLTVMNVDGARRVVQRTRNRKSDFETC